MVIVKREVIQVNTFNWQSRYSVGGPYAAHSNGQVWRGEVIFRPSKEIGVNPTFKEWEVHYTLRFLMACRITLFSDSMAFVV